jgi:hypothetical protein
MTAAEWRFWRSVQRMSARLEPDLARAIRRAFALLRSALGAPDFERLIAVRDTERLVREFISPEVLERASVQVRRELRRGLERSVSATARAMNPTPRRSPAPRSAAPAATVLPTPPSPVLPRAARPRARPPGSVSSPRVTIAFDVLNPRVLDAVRALDTEVVHRFGDQTRRGLLATVAAGLRDRKTPAQIARELRASVGLTEKQAARVEQLRAELATTGLSPSEIEQRIEAFRRNAIRRNASTLARTASLDAMKLGQKLAWDDAIAKGLVDRDRLRKTWRGVMDDRERPTHRAMEGETRRYDEPYSNGQMIPGDSEYNCRCVSVYWVA